MGSISKVDFNIIDTRVKKLAAKHALSCSSHALLYMVLEQLFPAIQDALPETITDGSDDRGVDAIHIIEGDTHAEVFILQSKYRDTQDSCSRTINDAEILKVSLFLEDLRNQSDTLATCNNLRLLEAVRRIWNIHSVGKICSYRIIFCSNGSGFSDSAQKIIKGVTDSHSNVAFEFYGSNDIVRSLAQDGASKESGKLQVIGKEILERIDGDVRGVIASIDAKSFIELIKTPDGQGIKRHLFDENLRIFLGTKGGYNSNIIETASTRDSYLFWYLNNGITITCKNFSYNKGHANIVLTLDSFQIVNGAQTSHSLFEAYRTGAAEFENVVLMVRIYATDRGDIAERVAIATNSQARIQGRDLRANAAIMIKLELAFGEHGYFFERKRNMHADKPDEKRIDALKLGQIILAYDLRDPDQAKSASDSIFDSRFESVFNDTVNVKRLISLYELYRRIESLRDKYNNEHGENSETGHPHQFLVYGHWFVLYACGLIAGHKYEGKIPEGINANILVEEGIQLVAKACGQQKAVAHYQMFRSPRTKDKIVAELCAKQADFFDLLVRESA